MIKKSTVKKKAGDAESVNNFAEKLFRDLEKQTKITNTIVDIALKCYKSSTNVLDLTSLLRFSALNVFIKTEKNNVGNNVFAPVSIEFMELVRSYETLTKEFGSESTRFVEKLVTYVINLRRYRLFITGVISVIICIQNEDENTSPLKLDEVLNAFRLRRFNGLQTSDRLKKVLVSYSDAFSRYLNLEIYSHGEIRKNFVRLRNIDRRLSSLSNIGEYAAHLAKIEASRLQGREDLIATFDDIHKILSMSLEELQSMRSRFKRGSDILNSFNIGI